MDRRGEVTYFSPQTTLVEGGPHAYQTKKTIFRTYQVLWYILGVIEVLLAFRVVLKFLGANTASPFTRLVYGMSEPFAAPFRGVFGPTVVDRSVMEWSSIVGMLVYVILVTGLVKIFQLIKPVEPEEVEHTVDSQ